MLAILSCCAVWLAFGACKATDLDLGSNESAQGVAGGGASPRDGGAHGGFDATAGCAPGYGNCDDDPSNGCETDFSRDREHCGDCEQACTAPDCQCMAGQLLTLCADERADCNGDPSDGCEVDVTSDAKHCGSCGNACPLVGMEVFGATCVDGHCKLTCETAHADCDADPANGCEVNLLFDNGNCGACGVACTCSAGHCQ